MAIIESGILGGLPSADKCLAHPSLSDRFGLERPYKIIAEGGEEIELPVAKPIRLQDGRELRFYRHPELFVSDTCELWKLDYKTKIKYGTSKEIEDFHPCYLEAETIYENWIGKNG